MNAFSAVFRKLSAWMNGLAGTALCFMMMLTVVDVILRCFGTAVLGTYEIVAMTGAVVVGFAVPQTSWDRGHVAVDFLLENRSRGVRNTVMIMTRIVSIVLFALVGYRLYIKAMHLYTTGEVSLTLHIPFYPVAFGLAFCFVIECFVLIGDIHRVITETEEGQNG
jgi:TRAP-type C4-dicarboxylate transport system permease small subunit